MRSHIQTECIGLSSEMEDLDMSGSDTTALNNGCLHEHEGKPNEPALASSITSGTCLWQLPWEDIVFIHILPLLDIKELLILSTLSVDLRIMVHEYIRQMKTLKVAGYGSKISATALESILLKSENCQQVNLWQCKFSLTDKVFQQFLKTNRRLIYINISECSGLTNPSLQTLAVNCKQLSFLSLQNCAWVTPEAITNISLHCRNILHLNLSGCWSVSDDAICTISASCSRLQSLDLSRIYGITDKAIASLAHRSSRLLHLNVADCWRITDYGLGKILEYSKFLQMLHIKGCRSITFNLIKRFREKGVKLDCLQPTSGVVLPDHPPVQI